MDFIEITLYAVITQYTTFFYVIHVLIFLCRIIQKHVGRNYNNIMFLFARLSYLSWL